MLLLKSIREHQDRSGLSKKGGPFHFHYAPGLDTLLLAYKVDSLVRVSRRVVAYAVRVLSTSRAVLSVQGVFGQSYNTQALHSLPSHAHPLTRLSGHAKANCPLGIGNASLSTISRTV